MLRIGFFTGVVCQWFDAIGHFFGHILGVGPPANEQEKTLNDLLYRYEFNMGGTPRTLGDLSDGFSLFFSLAMVLFGLINVLLWRAFPEKEKLRPFILLNVLFMGILVVMCKVYFITPPLVVSSIGLAGFIAAGIGISRKGS